MDKKEIKTKVGDTVIRYDGLKGKVIQVYDNGVSPEIKYEDGRIEELRSLQKYYLIGHTVLGNKAKEEEIESAIDVIDSKIKPLQDKKKQLRKQLWRLREEMVEDWKERKQARMNKKENQSTENNTED